ncbi:MAG TPA: class I SAM-dependent methyltransferase [Candidatus Krumholzibacteria bacterium]|nr:class I SAM-dependent methyltransferase [Candidatus Krumholzibacteria bacterium]HPD71976.1 class I SAM-dependent methyltransferase [Candidatus Krumholzibacteria bacterium]HRY41091.1 class I SAM-dependent methyltransferase [Candidatus Krumholzibacteria bacterium]
MTDAWIRDALRRIADRPRPPRPWRDGRQIPWNDPEFSRRVLSVHLDPSTHMASRTPDVIAEHVTWLRELLSAEPPPVGRPRHVLDLGCGPGLYAVPLAQAGLRVTGIDFSPAAVAHARRLAADAGLDSVAILEADLTSLASDLIDRLGPVDVVTFWFGEFSSFPPEVARAMVSAVAAAVPADGLLVIEYQPWDLFPRENSTSWSVAEDSVFATGPHLWLQEFAWDEEARAEITVHWILDPASGRLDRYAQCHQAYTDRELAELLAAAGFDRARFFPPITGVDERFEFPMVVARRRL